jgi:hypothetical protein
MSGNNNNPKIDNALKKELIHFKLKDNYQKKITVSAIWIFILCLPLFIMQFLAQLSIFSLDLNHSVNIPPYLILTGIYAIGAGVLFRIQFLRLLIVLISYISLAFMLAKYIEKKLRLYAPNQGCFSKYLGHGIDYNALIFPEKILGFCGAVFLIIVIYSIFIYIFSNKESQILFSLSKKYIFRETIVLTTMSIILFSATLWFLINEHNTCFNPRNNASSGTTHYKIIKSPQIKLPKSSSWK